MLDEIRIAFNSLKEPYIASWVLLAPPIVLLTPNDNIKVILFCILLLVSTGIWLSQKYLPINKITPSSNNRKFKKVIYSTVKKAIHYLENANNKTEYDQRMRHSPSVMETATVIGAITLGNHFLKKEYAMNEKGMAWLFERLKSQFHGVLQADKTAGFDCQKCRGKNQCNIAYFDYLSHFLYCKGTSLYTSFLEHFSFLPYLLKQRLLTVQDDQSGWSVNTSSQEIDPLATSTLLHLCIIFESLSEQETEKIIKTLIKLQNLDGSWSRPIEASRFCGGTYPIITTHRVIEIFMICAEVSHLQHIKSSILEAVKRASIFLRSVPLIEDPVSYDLQAGYTSPEIYRTIGHIAQGLIKGKELESHVLKERISFLLNNQLENGAFPLSNNIDGHNRTVQNSTDITAFILRTLVFYANSIDSK